jgi:hypothetical protein
MSGAIYFFQSLIGSGKKSVDSSKKKVIKGNQEKSEIIPLKKQKPKKEQKVIPLKAFNNPERKKVLEDLKGNFQKAYNASFKLKKLAKDTGTDSERFQIQVIHSQMRVIAKALENLKK